MELIQRQTSLSANVIAFCRHLRQHGFTIGVNEEADALRALTLQVLSEPEYFKLTLQAVLTKTVQQQVKFGPIFDEYWKQLEKAVNSKRKDTLEDNGKTKKSGKSKAEAFNTLKSWLYNETETEEKEVASYSTGQTMSQRDFASFSEEEMQEVMDLIHQIAKSLANRYNRRYKKNKKGQLDLRQVLRKNLRRGGEIMELAYRKPQKQRLQLVMLCDVSQSMDLYSLFLIQFIYAFQLTYRRIETFVFSTALHRISHALRNQDFSEALEELSQEWIGWSGGTRIGYCLDDFYRNHGPQLLNHQTVVLMLSDGWDTGDVDLLADTMQKIQQKAAKVIWLNPLAGNPDYEPTVQGMAACLPYIDVFASAHNVESLRKVVKEII